MNFFFNSIIPLPFYTPLFYYTILVLVLSVVLKLSIKGYTIKNQNKKEYASFILLLACTLYMGLRPISGYYFADMAQYNYYFELYASGAAIEGRSDILWSVFMKICSGIMSAKIFFLVCAVLYVFPLYYASKKWLGGNNYLLFLMLLASFSFWPYGTNGMRNGIATSLFILGISCRVRFWQFGLIGISYFVHGSMIVPIFAFILSRLYKNPRHYLIGWLLSIPFSLVLGSALELFFLSLGFNDDRLSYLTDKQFSENFTSSGFRWDFLLYSSSAVYAGYYFIVKQKFKDPIYIQLCNIYLTANAFWILVIRASFSNRFAYLSWFLMAVIIFYPFLKKKHFKKQQQVLIYAILVYFGFTYLMFM